MKNLLVMVVAIFSLQTFADGCRTCAKEALSAAKEVAVKILKSKEVEVIYAAGHGVDDSICKGQIDFASSAGEEVSLMVSYHVETCEIKDVLEYISQGDLTTSYDWF